MTIDADTTSATGADPVGLVALFSALEADWADIVGRRTRTSPIVA